MKQRAFEIINMHTGIHELWILKKGVRVKEIQNLIDILDSSENEDYEAVSDYVSCILEKKVEDSLEVNFRDKDNDGNYNGYNVVNKLRVPRVY